MSALREKVAKAIGEAYYREISHGKYGLYEMGDVNDWTSEANAAIALVLEEAAKVAERMSDEWAAERRRTLKCDLHMEGMSDGADDVAAAIRALKEKA